MRGVTVNRHGELYKYNKVPFGLKITPAIIQHVDAMLAICQFAIPYLDEIFIKSNSRDQHNEHIKSMFENVRDYGFIMSEEKCEFLAISNEEVLERSGNSNIGSKILQRRFKCGYT